MADVNDKDKSRLVKKTIMLEEMKVGEIGYVENLIVKWLLPGHFVYPKPFQGMASATVERVSATEYTIVTADNTTIKRVF